MKKLRKHQKEAITALQKVNKGIINLPTGTGKSLIQSRFIFEEIKASSTCEVYVIVSPRILLSNQLLKDTQADLIEQNIDALYLSVHSGRPQVFDNVIIHRDLHSTTSSIKIREEYERAQREGVNLIISATYDSLERIHTSNIPVKVVLCDEAHYLVTTEFNHYTDNFPCEKIFFFTATLKDTRSDEGMGMNNISKFGEVIYSKTPLEMIIAGEIVRPRMHFARTTVPIQIGDIVDAKAIVECFKEHSAMLEGIGAKILIVCKGSDHLDKIAAHPEIEKLKRKRPHLSIFDISSEYHPRINGEEVTRETFLSRLQDLTDSDEAIILHIDILTEGIDVPGITGIMPLNNLKKSKFLQTLGRATRLYSQDRIKLYSKEIKPTQLDDMTKPYAYIIIPTYGELGSDLGQNIINMVYELRSYGFNPREDVVIKELRGSQLPIQIQDLGVEDIEGRGLGEFIGNIIHNIESDEAANEVHESALETKSLEDIINHLLSF